MCASGAVDSDSSMISVQATAGVTIGHSES